MNGVVKKQGLDALFIQPIDHTPLRRFRESPIAFEIIVHFAPRFLKLFDQRFVVAFVRGERSFSARRATHQRLVAIRVAIEATALANHHQRKSQTIGMILGESGDALGQIAPLAVANRH